ncbi:GtrA family protein [Apilactobacillus xinyiensis]|uniref:GtrA family protein n=1 Tax=Apilactobacillus xinyiensis TaxID=2841032 RepID=A0ABT0I189_9LACO|nr:GtrA family protein [Apilactobacillus xinyiensis]MCK8624297.1 GtrA family protein [Apilactobacillus xinyiensis]MCL0319171.1 GtrA family protein [Apilactobacillus xinyiensis]
MKIIQNNKQVISYLFWGVMTTLINIVAFMLLQKFTSWNYNINNSIAWIASVVFAYVTNRKWVFHSKSSSINEYLKEFISFSFGRFASFIMEEIILWVFITALGLNAGIAKVVGQVVVIVFNYFWSKLAVFKNKKDC